MKIRRWLATGSLLFALLLPQPAMAQEHGESGHGQTEQSETHGRTEHGEHAHGDGAEGAHASHEPEEINWTTFGGTRRDHAGNIKPNPPPFVATLINFGLLAAILFFAVKRVINPALATRRAAIEAEIAEAQRRLAEAEAQLREFKEKLANSKQEFARIREEFVRLGESEAQKILDEARAKAERMQTEAQALIDQEIRNLRADLIREAVEAAMKSAEQTVRSSINEQDQSRLAEAFLDSLDQVAVSDRGSV
jgi:F-type H+-transporting ATPase subunit b